MLEGKRSTILTYSFEELLQIELLVKLKAYNEDPLLSLNIYPDSLYNDSLLFVKTNLS